MAMLSVQVTVGDFAKWRTAFQKYEPMRNAAGVTNPRIYRGADKTNDVLVLFDVANVAKARETLASAELKSVMQEAGVIGPPKTHFIE